MLAVIVYNFVKRDLYILSRPAMGSIEDVGRQAAHAYSTEKFGLLREGDASGACAACMQRMIPGIAWVDVSRLRLHATGGGWTKEEINC
jgi:hypothetical protein